MKLIDRVGKDYYDGILCSMYRDTDLLYVRDQKCVRYTHDEMRGCDFSHAWKRKKWDFGILNKKWPFGHKQGFYVWWYSNREIQQKLRFICFCGKVYPCIEEWVRGSGEKSTFHYEAREKDHKDIKDMFEAYKNPPQEYLNHWMKMCDEERSPIFVGNPSEQCIEWNAYLKEYDFHQIMNQHQMAQEVYMFFSNLGNPEKPIPEPDDTTKILQHGMDPKTSFRKEKQNG